MTFPYPIPEKKKKKKKIKESAITKRVKSYNHHEVNYAKERIVSYSQFSTYSTCQYRWYLEKVAKKSEKLSNIHFVFGNAIHETLQNYLTIMFNESGAAADRFDNIQYFEDKMGEHYEKDYKKNNKHFSSPEELDEFYNDGIAIIEWFVKRRKDYFSKKGCELVGVESPLVINMGSNIYMKGYIDLVIYDSDLDKIYIYDIKTSTKGWSDWQKKDKNKISQVLLYKKYFAETYAFPIERIKVKYFILKRKIPENTEFPGKRVQQFAPSEGKTSVKNADESFRQFLSESFDSFGKPKERNYIKNVNEFSCKFCEFKDKLDLCDKKNIIK
jgi:hypothetical protein